MTVKRTVTIGCDFCHAAKSYPEGENIPKGWVAITVENTYEDRSFVDKHLCPDCVGHILKEVKKNGGE